MNDAVSLTRGEAEERARLIDVIRYDIDVDLRGLAGDGPWESTSTVTFACHEPGRTSFVDCAADVRRATLNGAELDADAVAGGRIRLTGLRAENRLVVSVTQADTGSSAGILRTVDPTDGAVYVWTSLECDDARRLWACFDQPDLKAPHRFTVTAPADWTVTSNMRPGSIGDPDAGARTWSFPETPPLSTYVTVVNAGPFHEVRDRRGPHSLGLYCRRSMASYLERDARWLLDTTESGLAFFGDRFGQPFPEAHYDQVFVPNMAGAMENWGCVTWGDGYLFRSPPTYSQRSTVAVTLLHEMAHMWFGDLVTMRWWDDLWLNEAFASWAATWAAAHTTEFTEAWSSFLLGRKLDAYRIDMGPASHPIRNDVPDVTHALANFDSITYAKGQSVLHQLMAYVGEQAFTEGLQQYFRVHAWGNTRLADLMAAVGEAAGRDLGRWTQEWLDRAGTDTLTLTADAVVATAADGGEPRPHRIDIGSYTDAGTLLGRTPVETDGAHTPLPALPDGALHLPNDTDLTFAAVRTGDDSLPRLLARAGTLPEPINRAVAVATGVDLLRGGELPATDVLDCVLGVLAVERTPALVEPMLTVARDTAELWCPLELIGPALSRVADVALTLSEDVELRRPALQVLAATASTAEHEAVLAAAAEDDLDLAWRIAQRRAESGHHDADAVVGLLERDPDPDAPARAAAVTAARPEESAKADTWQQLFERRSVPAGHPTVNLAKAFWRPGQHDLLLPWAHRYLTEVASISGGFLSTLSIVRSMFPMVGDDDFLARATELCGRPDLEPMVRNVLLSGTDTLTRMLRARSA